METMSLSLYHYLGLSAIVFSIGIYGVLTRRNILGIFMSIELMFNAANLNLVAFNRYLHPGEVWGQGIVVFVITVAAAEAVVGLALVLAIHRNIRSVYTEKMSLLHG
jgi:NADH:ubiquinone oxidoreductase subunit K